MTAFRDKRCVQCGAPYTFQELDDSRYCPSCKAVLNEALAKIPVRFECRYFPVSEVPAYADVTRALVEEWEADLALQRESDVVTQRVWIGLTNPDTDDNQFIREVTATSGPHRGTPFRVSSWTVRPEYHIEIGLEWDLMNQTLGSVWRGDSGRLDEQPRSSLISPPHAVPRV